MWLIHKLKRLVLVQDGIYGKGDTETAGTEPYETLKRVIDMGIKVPMVQQRYVHQPKELQKSPVERRCDAGASCTIQVSAVRRAL